MKALFIVLNDLDFLSPILEKFIELKIKGATIVESEGMRKVILQNEGLSSLMKNIFSPNPTNYQDDSKTIFTVIKEDSQVQLAVEEIQKLLSQSKKDTVGFMFTVPVADIYPLKKH